MAQKERQQMARKSSSWFLRMIVVASTWWYVCLILLGALFSLGNPVPLVAGTTNLTVTIIGDKACNDGIDNDGDGKIDYPNDSGCDSTNDTSEEDPPSPPPASGGGGGGGGIVASPSTVSTTGAILKGRAYPESDVTLLDNARVLAITKAGHDAVFEIALSGITPGTHSFGVWAEDEMGNRSSVQTFTVAVTAGVTTSVSGIFLPPTITADKIQVRRGDPITMLGQSAPFSTITLVVNSEHELVRTITTDESGVWSEEVDTLLLEYGSHTARSRAENSGQLSTLSKVVGFQVGTRTVFTPKTVTAIGTGDINGDRRVNLVDFSIMAYWYQKQNPPPHVDINRDARVDLIDFSIMAFNWSG